MRVAVSRIAGGGHSVKNIQSFRYTTTIIQISKWINAIKTRSTEFNLQAIFLYELLLIRCERPIFLNPNVPLCCTRFHMHRKKIVSLTFCLFRLVERFNRFYCIDMAGRKERKEKLLLSKMFKWPGTHRPIAIFLCKNRFNKSPIHIIAYA